MHYIKFLFSVILGICFFSCTDNYFRVDDERLNKTDIASEKKNVVNFYPRVLDFSLASEPGYTLFQEGNIAQVFIFVTKGNCILNINNFYKAYENGSISPLSNTPIEVVSGYYDFYIVSVNSSDKPPVFNNGMAYNIDNGTDYIWYYVRSNIVQNPTTLPVEFTHSAVQIIITVDNTDTDVIADYINYAALAEPIAPDSACWNIYNGSLTPATSVKSSPTYAMVSSELASHQFILPLNNVSSIPVYIRFKIKEIEDYRGFTLNLPAIDDNKFVGGTSYQYSVKLKDDTVYFSSAVIAPWKEVNEDGDLIMTDENN